MKQTKIIAFPFAGGNKFSYRELEKHLPENFSWECIELAGRGARIQEDPIPDISQMALNIYPEVLKISEESEFIIFGHSMGTLLGYEITKMLIRDNKQLPKFLFFTGRGAPEVEKEKKISQYDSKEFWQEIKKMGGVPDEILENEELLEFFEPMIRSDFRAVEDYQYNKIQTPFDIPVFIRTGDQEDISSDKIEAWQKETSLPIDKEIVTGNHFFIFENAKIIVNHITEAYVKTITDSLLIN